MSHRRSDTLIARKLAWLERQDIAPFILHHPINIPGLTQYSIGICVQCRDIALDLFPGASNGKVNTHEGLVLETRPGG